MREVRIAGERWRTVPKHPHYMVSDHGRVLSMARMVGKPVTDTLGRKQPAKWWKSKELHGHASRSGYQVVSLTSSGSQQLFGIHQLVMLAFSGPPPEGTCVDHINSKKSDNRLANLRYLTRSENTARASRGEKNHRTHLNDEAIKVIRHCYRTGRVPLLAALHRISKSNCAKIVWGLSWKHVNPPSRTSP
jgi:hypothetical protein